MTSRADRGLQVLRELKTKPHRVFTAGPVFTENAGGDFDLFTTRVEETRQILACHIHNRSKRQRLICPDLNLSDRTSNGSFIDRISDKEVFSAKIIEQIKIRKLCSLLEGRVFFLDEQNKCFKKNCQNFAT